MSLGKLIVCCILAGQLPLLAIADNRQQASIDAFLAAAEVLQHPRCTNCHAKGDVPRQSEQRGLHMLNVKRGPADRGASGYTCKSCHQNANIAGIPGADDWHMAPLTMSWGDSNVAEICARLTDTARNGNRRPVGIVLHVENDVLVNWAWSPGDRRAQPPISHAEFVKLMQRWAASGAYCPK